MIKDGSNIGFWRDSWVPGFGKLEEQFQDSIPAEELNYPVDFYASDEGWNWHLFDHIVSDEMKYVQLLQAR